VAMRDKLQEIMQRKIDAPEFDLLGDAEAGRVITALSTLVTAGK
jgi:hypothetical protein